jgi:hypothetical protein
MKLNDMHEMHDSNEMDSMGETKQNKTMWVNLMTGLTKWMDVDHMVEPCHMDECRSHA